MTLSVNQASLGFATNSALPHCATFRCFPSSFSCARRFLVNSAKKKNHPPTPRSVPLAGSESACLIDKGGKAEHTYLNICGEQGEAATSEETQQGQEES